MEPLSPGLEALVKEDTPLLGGCLLVGYLPRTQGSNGTRLRAAWTQEAEHSAPCASSPLRFKEEDGGLSWGGTSALLKDALLLEGGQKLSKYRGLALRSFCLRIRNLLMIVTRFGVLMTAVHLCPQTFTRSQTYTVYNVRVLVDPSLTMNSGYENLI
ncbi:Arf-Gap With Rho-Gap Domain, Ank Repeat And Ph Domain-Containing Protein 1 [Manis pentadactyla]|nr:Arf-Gap With Rho-Gap Domain, Ank Repeat And Ph Domain-Containing Protein 1 [Manis pentadactyla]